MTKSLVIPVEHLNDSEGGILFQVQKKNYFSKDNENEMGRHPNCSKSCLKTRSLVRQPRCHTKRRL